MPCAENTGAVVLALSAFDPGHWVVPLLLSELTPEEAFRVLRLCSGLTFPIHSMRGEEGIEEELREILSDEKADAILSLGDTQTVDFQHFRELHKTIETARCFTFARALGPVKAAERLGLPKTTVRARRAYVYRKLNGG